jgi:N-acetyl-anhydromuramyl-L-alanine amidase AmpD
MAINGEDAKAFFEQLGAFSKRYIAAEIGPDLPHSPWCYESYEVGHPRGAVIHYTADEELHRVLRWFLVPEFGAKVSAHAVVADRRMGVHDKLAEDLPLVEELPVTVIQVLPPDLVAWHARWANRRTYAIENVNAGPLRADKIGDDGFPESFCSWRARDRKSQEWTKPWSSPYKTPEKVFGRWWEPYTPGQVEANVILLRYLKQLVPEMAKPWLLGHENVQERKLDPGPMFPLVGVREAVWDDWKPVQRYGWYRLFQHEPDSGKLLRDEVVMDHLHLIATVTKPVLPRVAWMRFSSAMRALPSKSGFGVTGKTGLKLLGYHVTSLDEGLDTDELLSVWIFQKMMGLKTDMVPGPLTKAALVDRLDYLGFLEGETCLP